VVVRVAVAVARLRARGGRWRRWRWRRWRWRRWRGRWRRWRRWRRRGRRRRGWRRRRWRWWRRRRWRRRGRGRGRRTRGGARRRLCGGRPDVDGWGGSRPASRGWRARERRPTRRLRNCRRVNDDRARPRTKWGADSPGGRREKVGDQRAAGHGDSEEERRDHTLLRPHVFPFPARFGIWLTTCPSAAARDGRKLRQYPCSQDLGNRSFEGQPYPRAGDCPEPTRGLSIGQRPDFPSGLAGGGAQRKPLWNARVRPRFPF
jgi:hypothetical protein